MPDEFDQKKVEQSFRKFRDFSSDVLVSDKNTFSTRFNGLLKYCENDEILSVITNQLKDIDVNIDEWWENGLKSGTGFTGSCQFILPTEETERDALLYQFSLKVDSGNMSFQNFCMMFLGKSNFNEMVYAFNEAVVRPLVRSINYKLEEISAKVDGTYDDSQKIPINIFNVYQDQSTTFEKDVTFKKDGVIGHESKIEKK